MGSPAAGSCLLWSSGASSLSRAQSRDGTGLTLASRAESCKFDGAASAVVGERCTWGLPERGGGELQAVRTETLSTPPHFKYTDQLF